MLRRFFDRNNWGLLNNTIQRLIGPLQARPFSFSSISYLHYTRNAVKINVIIYSYSISFHLYLFLLFVHPGRWLWISQYLKIDTEILFDKGINVFIGENGTGKTHILILLYSACQASNPKVSFPNKIVRTMLPDDNAGTTNPIYGLLYHNLKNMRSNIFNFQQGKLKIFLLRFIRLGAMGISLNIHQQQNLVNWKIFLS